MSLPPLVALEVGTSKIRAVIAEARDDGHLMIIGLGESPSRGVRKGEITNLENALESVKMALKEAEDKSEVIIHEVLLMVSGGHISSMINRGSAPVMAENGEIDEEDIEHVMDTARAVNIPSEREIIHTVCQNFYVDDHLKVSNPEGMEGNKIALDMLIVHGMRSKLRNLVKVVRDIPMELQDVAFSGLCSALGVLDAKQKESGVTVIDLGAGTTDFVVYSGNAIAAVGSLAIGGDHVTNDISRGLKLSQAQAEGVKIDWGNAIVQMNSEDQTIPVPQDGGQPGRMINLRDVQLIVNARVDETFQLIRDDLDKRDLLDSLSGGIVLTGGGAHLRNITELAERIFDLPAHVGKPRDVSGIAHATEGPEFAATVGLLRYGFKTMQDEDRSGILDMIMNFLPLGR